MVATSGITFVASLITFIVSGGFIEEYNNIKDGNLKNNGTIGTVSMLYSSPVLTILGILMGIFCIYWIVSYLKREKKHQKVLIIIALNFMVISAFALILIQISEKLCNVRDENGHILYIDLYRFLYPFFTNDKVFNTTLLAIMITFLIGTILFFIMSYFSKLKKKFSSFVKSTLLDFGAIPLLLLIIENTVYIFYIIIIGLLIFMVLWFLSGVLNDDDTVDTLAREVIAGKWGNGDERKKRLTAAGYDYAAVQRRVNELLK